MSSYVLRVDRLKLRYHLDHHHHTRSSLCFVSLDVSLAVRIAFDVILFRRLGVFRIEVRYIIVTLQFGDR